MVLLTAPVSVVTMRFGERLEWTAADSARLGDLDFAIEPLTEPDAATQAFQLYKPRGLIDDYGRFFAGHPSFAPRDIFELGIWDGGNTALWFEHFRPRRLVAVDVRPRATAGRLEDYQRTVGDALRVYWDVDQRDRERLAVIVAQDFAGGLDLVVDDAPHLYEPTRASFEALFPHLRPGGMYVIEDWAWAHWSPGDADAPFNAEGTAVPSEWLRDEVPLSRLVVELTAMLGSTWLIAGLTVRPGFVAVERGTGTLHDSDRFAIDNHIVHRATQSLYVGQAT